MAIKIIDLLNCIANKEPVPKRIKWQGYELTYDINIDDYIGLPNSTDGFFNYLFSNNPTSLFINGEVEMLKSEEETDIKMFEQEWFEQHRLVINEVECDLVVKINEIIDFLLKLDKKINKGE